MTKRIQRVNELILRALGEIILKEYDFMKVDGVTITSVDTSKDLRAAKVCFSTYKGDQDTALIVQNQLNSEQSRIRRLLAKNIRLKYLPELSFKYDGSQLKLAQLDVLFQKIKKEKNDDQ